MSICDSVKIGIEGHVKILGYDHYDDLKTKQNAITLLDDHNAVHRENASIAIARGLTCRPNGCIHFMAFGNGGATIDPLGAVVLNPPNTVGAADLYNQTYYEGVTANDDFNFMAIRHINGSLYTEIDVHCVLNKNEPYGQHAQDSGPMDLNTEPFSFSEIGLKTADNLLLTHITFTPIMKNAQRIIEVVYTLKLSIV